MGLIDAVAGWQADVEARYVAARPRSAALGARAKQALPGGDTRFSATLEPFSTVFTEARGQDLWDVDGNRVIDVTNNNTALIHGHAHPAIVDAITRQVAGGTAWVGPNPPQIELAELLAEQVPSVERVRFTNSSSEANLLMVKIARAYTGRDLVMKLDAAYHGCADLFEFGPSADDPSRARPLMAGLPANLADNLVIGRFNDADFTVDLIRRHADRLAAVIVTPVWTAGRVAAPEPAFLAAVRAATAERGILLLYDEVISLRLARGGAQALYGVAPDLTAMGKIIGGGFPVGAVGGRERVMRVTDPSGPATVLHAGTYNGNVISMTAGLVGMRLLTPSAYARLEEAGQGLEAALTGAVRDTGAPFRVTRVASLLSLDLDAPAGDTEWAAAAPRIRTTLRNAFLIHGVLAIGLNATTVITDAQIGEVATGIHGALAELMAFVGVAA